MKYDNLDLPDVRFLEGCVDECAINGDIVANELIFTYGKPQWNPKLMGD